MKKLTNCKICLIIITTFFVLCAADCSKDKDKPAYYMPQDFKDYVVFPEGSYWVYEDSVTGDIDSVYLQSQKIEIYTPPSYNNPGYNFEFLKENVFSSNSNQVFYKEGIYNQYIPSNINNSYLYRYDIQLYYISSVDIGTTISNLTYKSFLDSLTVKSKTFKKVKVFSTPPEYYSNGSFLCTYYGHNVGLIKLIKKVCDTCLTETWLLKKYHINN